MIFRFKTKNMNRQEFTKELFEAVEIVTGIKEEQIKARTRKGLIPDARKVVINILHDAFKSFTSWRLIGVEVGYDDRNAHSCAIAANKKALNYLDVCPNFKNIHSKVLIMRHLLSYLKEIDGERVRNWKIQKEGDAFVVRVCNGTTDYIDAPEIESPKGFKIVRSSCLEMDGRLTEWRYVLTKN